MERLQPSQTLRSHRLKLRLTDQVKVGDVSHGVDQEPENSDRQSKGRVYYLTSGGDAVTDSDPHAQTQDAQIPEYAAEADIESGPAMTAETTETVTTDALTSMAHMDSSSVMNDAIFREVGLEAEARIPAI
ncbi:unnamed protein product [Phytophthora lilii]|uniref:Unnamed protein product n=1 Tax=Phytophthora lilii TaxID=2077276 RepID=A0A9W6TNL1_9STRA|nr:unnamed protein product [Phytophthora lilii]